MSQGEWKETSELIRTAIAILEVEHPMTVRQLFYRLVSKGALENTKKDYQLTSKIMTKARKDCRCPYEWIVDRSRPTYEPNVFEDAAEYAETVKHSYRKNYWSDQPNHVEVWTEKDAIIGSIEPVTDELGVTVRVGRGFFSTTRINEIAQEFQRVAKRGKKIFVLYLGDHDPSGIEIQKDGGDRLHALLFARLSAGWFYQLQRVAILKRDVSLFNLSPLRVKNTDTRSNRFRHQHGEECVELDALPPQELRSRLRTAIEALIDKERWDRAVAVEEVELNNIRETVGTWFPGETR
jgi:hypothetical protein